MKQNSRFSIITFCIILTVLFFSIPGIPEAAIFIRIDNPAVYINGPDTATFTLNCGDTKILPPGGTLSFYVTGWANDILDYTYLCIDSLPEGASFVCQYNFGTGSVTSLFTWTPPVGFSGTLRFFNQGLGCEVYFDEPLPVELASFTSVVNGNNVTLNWQTASENNNSGFEIEKTKLTGESNLIWIRAGNVAGNGTTVTSMDYTYTDRIFDEGIYKYRLKQIDYNGNSEYYYLSNNVMIVAPEKYELSQNYPNPFNPSTVINYQLSKFNNVSLKVYDINGKEVATLVNGKKDAGYYTVIFDGKDLSSGVYYYKLESGNFKQTRRMLLLR